MARINFDVSNVAPQESVSPIPAGVYLAHVVESDVRPLKSGNGEAIALTFQVLAGPYANRKVFANLNVRHTSAESERIAQAQFSALCHAAGVMANDTTQLHMRPVHIRVKVRKDDTGQYGDRNEVTGYEAAPSGTTPPRSAPPAAQPTFAPQRPPQAPAGAAVQPPAPATPAWARRPVPAQA